MKRIFFLLSFFAAAQLSAQNLVTSTPITLFGDHIFISLSVDDSAPIDFIFDTGDGLSVIDLDIAQSLNLKADHQASKTSAQGSVSGALIQHNKIEINDVVIKEIELYSTSLRHLEQSIGRNIDGIIGYDLLRNYVIKIDYEDMMMKFYDQSDFDYSGYGEGFKFKLVNYIPCISASVTLNNGETLESQYFVNTGAGTTMDFNTRYADKQGIIGKTGEHFSYPVAGLGDQETMHYEGRVKNFSLGTFNFEMMPIGISQAKHGIQHHKKAAGIIGNRLLKKFNMTLDYKNDMIYLEANKKFEDPILVNASGLNLQLSKDLSQIVVHRVYAGSPAESAGVQQEAIMLEVNGQQVSEYTLPELRDLLKEVNKNVMIKYSQNGIEKEAALDLTALL